MSIPVVLSIAGSDSGGGAGIQADIKTCQELGVYAATSITAITAQNTLGVQEISTIEPELVYAQADAVLKDIGAQSLKTGMLVSKHHIEMVSRLIDKYAVKNVVVDPVIASTSGTALLDDEGIKALNEKLLPKTTVFTPNLPEAAFILNRKEPETIAEMKEAAVQLYKLGPKYIVLKGGHLKGDATDLIYDGQQFEVLVSKRIEKEHTHGTGCTFASAIAAELAKGDDVMQAIKTAKVFITEAIQCGFSLGAGKGPTNHAAYKLKKASEE
ncbi:bifunctional hydroxymethylpyrimidine kinase/phosphomethylpyrimidine kinase [Shouchella patagoniensis]|uniref:bifunctional hydroxymethylpyrimidine kinase/phosphomethylpyrimidine kinase n=1 Tax=Shouchella patagoniensis TaxID=228576 RepID=UPI000994E6D3|nr:bifunctional hydroxymethylpyrimidine kinase/phosphomethylpyrimidine kinase [Shouchella patagoniensis]